MPRLTFWAIYLLCKHPLSRRWVEELRFAGLGVRQLVAPAHYIELARSQVYGAPPPERTRELERRLARRRRAADIGPVLSIIERAPTLATATVAALDFAECLVSFSCFLVSNGRQVRVGAVSGGEPVPKEQFPVPAKGGTFGVALQYAGYYVGPLAGTQADHDFYRALGRPLPRYAFLAPVPMTNSLAVAFYADNGPRGMAARWVAELTLLAARLGQVAKALADRGRRRMKRHDAAVFPKPDVPPAAEEKVPPTARSTPPPLTFSEHEAIDRLRQAAAEADVTFEELVDELLSHRATRHLEPSAPPAAPSAEALMAEVRGLFSKLAERIPDQLAEGMESAFRDLAPRLHPSDASPSPPSAARPAPDGDELPATDREPFDD